MRESEKIKQWIVGVGCSRMLTANSYTRSGKYKTPTCVSTKKLSFPIIKSLSHI